MAATHRHHGSLQPARDRGARRLTRVLFTLAVSVPILVASASAQDIQKPAAPPNQPALVRSRGHALSFEENRGQGDPRVRFIARAKPYTLVLTDRDAVVRVDGSELRMRFASANARPIVQPEDELVTKTYYADARVGPLRSASHFGRVRYASVYPGVDAVFHGSHGRVQVDFHVAPGADPHDIRLGFESAQGLAVDESGDLLVRVGRERMRLKKPVLYQEVAGERRLVKGDYRVRGLEARFAIGRYDRSRPLVIDPIIEYATYLGSGGEDRIIDIEANAAGELFVFGTTSDRSTFPATAGVGRVGTASTLCFVSKFDAAGANLLYSIVFLDTYGLCDAMTLDPFGNVLTVYQSIDGAFVKTLRTVYEQSGSLGTSTKLLTALEGFLPAPAIRTDTAGNVYVIGGCFNTRVHNPYPLPNGFRTSPLPGKCVSPDQFFTIGPSESVLVKYDIDGSLQYGTFLSGGLDNETAAKALAIDDFGTAYVGGRTISPTLAVTADALQPVCGGSQQCDDGFLEKIDTTLQGSASLAYATFLGGSGSDVIESMAFYDGVLSLAGESNSSDFPSAQGTTDITGGGVFVTRLDLRRATDQLLFTTVLPTDLPPDGAAPQLRLMDDGSLAVAGITTALDFPVQHPLFDYLPGPFFPTIFATVVSPDGQTLRFSTPLDGFQRPRIASSGSSAMFVGMVTTADALATPGAFQPEPAGGIDLVLLKISGIPAAVSNQPPIAIAGPDQVTQSTSVFLDGSASYDPDGDPLSYVWMEGTTVLGTASFFTAVLSPGTHTIMLTVIDSHGATSTDSVEIAVQTAVVVTVSERITVTDTVLAQPSAMIAIAEAITVNDDADAVPLVGAIVDTAGTAVAAVDSQSHPTPVTVTVASVSEPSLLTADIMTTPPADAPPGYFFLTPVYDVVVRSVSGGSQATVAPPIDVCFGGWGYVAEDKLLHFENGAWIDTTSATLSSATNKCGRLTSLSPVVVVRPTVAVVPMPGTLFIAPPATINNSPGPQYDPHVSGDLVSYSDNVSPARIHYYRFSTGVDSEIPPGESRTDILSDVSGNRIAFTRALPDRNPIMVFDVQTGSMSEIDPQVGSNRLGSAIGGSVVAFVDYSTGPGTGDIIAWDLSATTPAREVVSIDQIAEQNPNVSPDGGVIVWEKCSSSPLLTTCDVAKAKRSSGGWSVATVASSSEAENNPDSDGTWIVYDANRTGSATGADIYIQPVAGGTEKQLAIADTQWNPSISRGIVAFESYPGTEPFPYFPSGPSDLFVYDIATNLLYQVTSTPDVSETLSDISVLDNGDVRVVWTANDGPGGERNVYGTTFSLLPSPTLTVAPVIGETRRHANITATLTSNGTPIAGQLVRFRLNGGPFLRDGATTDANGIASVMTTLDFPPGFYPGGVEAIFDGNFELRLGRATATADLTVTKAATSLTLSAAPSPSPLGQPVTLTATIQAALFPPPGSIDFSYRLGTTTAPIGQPVTIDPATGTATIVAQNLPLGALELIASYAENDEYLGSAAAIAHTIGRSQTTLVLASSRNPSLTTAPPIFYAQFEGLAAGQTPTGKVEFYVDRTLLCRSTVYTVGGVRSQASCGGASLPVGSHSIKAVYLGDSTFANSTATAITQRVFEGGYFVVDLGTDYEPIAISPSGHVVGNSPSDHGLPADFSGAFLYDLNGVLQSLPTLGGRHVTATDVNELGQVVGFSAIATGARHAFRFSNGQMDDLGTLGGASSAASAIDSNGTIVGSADTAAGTHAFRATRGGMVDLGTLGGSTSLATAINDNGSIAGAAERAGGALHAALFVPKPIDLGVLGGTTSIAWAINNAREAAGESDVASGARHAFIYRDGVMRDVVAGLDTPYSSSVAINDSGEVVGWFEVEDVSSGTRVRNGFRYGLDTFTDLGPGAPYAINNAGQAVGNSNTGAFVHNGSATTALATEVFGIAITGVSARAINDAGQIVGLATGRLGGGGAVLWNPIPASRLTVLAAAGIEGATTKLTATLVDVFGTPAVGKPIIFKLNGTSVGGDFTDASGSVSIDASLAGMAAGSYPGLITATFRGDATLVASHGAGDLTVIGSQLLSPAVASLSPTVVTINNSPGHQHDPHVSGDLVSYTDGFAPARTRYYRFSTDSGVGLVPEGSVTDVLSDVNDERITFSTAYLDRNAILVFDFQTGGIEIDPHVGTNRIGSAIGGNIVAFVDYGTGTTSGDIVAWDLSTSTRTLLSASGSREHNPNVAADGSAIVWEECLALLDCNVLKAVRSGENWVVSPVANTPDPEANPDTDGVWVVYDAERPSSPTDQDIYLQPLAGGPEIQLAIPGVQTNPSISRGFIAFDSAPAHAAADLFVYDVASNVLYQITSTPNVNETFSDISVLDNGDVRLVWDANDGPSGERNVYGTTLHLSPLARVNTGSIVTAQPTDLQGALLPITITFAQVNGAGVVFATPMSSVPPLGPGFVLKGTAYDIQTTAEYVPPVTVCFLGTFTAADRLLHYEGGAWRDVTTTRTATEICGSVTTLSPFAAGTINESPSLTLPAPIAVEATQQGGATVSYSVTASDPEDGMLQPLCSPAPGALFPLGTTAVSCSATDSAGAVTSGSFTILVRDTTPPVVTAPAAITVPATEAGGARASAWPALVAFLAGGAAADLVDAAPVRLTAVVAGSEVTSDTLFAIGTTTPVTFRFRDTSGNIGTAVSNVSVVLGTPQISIRIAANGTISGTRKFVDLELSNIGTGNARQLSLNGILLVAVRGRGAPKLVSPKLPLALGSLDAGRQTTVRLIVDVPSGVNTVSITEAGTFFNVKGTIGVYSQTQRFEP